MVQLRLTELSEGLQIIAIWFIKDRLLHSLWVCTDERNSSATDLFAILDSTLAHCQLVEVLPLNVNSELWFNMNFFSRFAVFNDLSQLIAVLSQTDCKYLQVTLFSILLLLYCHLDAQRSFKNNNWLWVIADLVPVFQANKSKATRIIIPIIFSFGSLQSLFSLVWLQN